jgi:16S rRNA (guanine966-N2)-methyltransferase
MSPKQHNSKTTNQLRIIGGQWRGRKLSFPTHEGLRPTPDRVRETLFNWLNSPVIGARCLDLFAGSGALGLEALSRGAQFVDFIDNSPPASQQLEQNLALLNANNAKVCPISAVSWLEQLSDFHHPDNTYNIIFIDPPFHKGLVAECIKRIHNIGILAPNSWVYLEMNNQEALPSLPVNWHLHREKIAGQVCYRLFSIDDGYQNNLRP